MTFLRQWWPTAERRALSGKNDRGDVTGLGPRYVIECKAARAIELATWIDETETERVNANADYGILVIKRRNKSVDKAYVVVPLWQMVQLMRGDDAA